MSALSKLPLPAGAACLSGSLAARLAGAAPQASVTFKALLPWHTLDGEDLRPFVEHLLDHPSKVTGPLRAPGAGGGGAAAGAA